VSDLKLLP